MPRPMRPGLGIPLLCPVLQHSSPHHSRFQPSQPVLKRPPPPPPPPSFFFQPVKHVIHPHDLRRIPFILLPARPNFQDFLCSILLKSQLVIHIFQACHHHPLAYASCDRLRVFSHMRPCSGTLKRPNPRQNASNHPQRKTPIRPLRERRRAHPHRAF